MTEEHEQLRKCVADAWDWSAAQLKDGVPPLDVAVALLAVAITMGKSLLGRLLPSLRRLRWTWFASWKGLGSKP